MYYELLWLMIGMVPGFFLGFIAFAWINAGDLSRRRQNLDENLADVQARSKARNSSDWQWPER